VLYVAGLMCRNLEYSISSMHPASNTYIDSFACLSLLLLIVFSEGLSLHILDAFITVEEKFVFIIVVLYSLYYILRNTHTVFTKSPHANPINSLLGVLTVSAMRIHMTLDNSYTAITTFLFCIRLLNKIWTTQKFLGDRGMGVEGGQGCMVSTMVGLDILTDSFILSILVFFGVIPQCSHNPAQVALYIAQATCIALVLNGFVNQIERVHRDKPTPADS
jgi:hypothetical protein